MQFIIIFILAIIFIITMLTFLLQNTKNENTYYFNYDNQNIKSQDNKQNNLLQFTELVTCGYQGWFSNNNNEGILQQWKHWSNGNTPSPGKVTFDLYPYVQDYAQESLQSTDLGNLGDGQASKLYASDTQNVIETHFKWIQQYGIDGFGMQRFVPEITGEEGRKWRNNILQKMNQLSQIYQKYIYIMYDISGGNTDTLLKTIQDDWNDISQQFQFEQNPYYARQNGQLVVNLWGFGFEDRPGNPDILKQLCQFFNQQGVFVVLGVPFGWREGKGLKSDFIPDDFLVSQMIQPWSVGAINDSKELNSEYQKSMFINDKIWCQQHNILYQRVIFPGFSWNNWNDGPKNQIPRECGKFLENQANFTQITGGLGRTPIYIAMFDEYDESTAIAKAAKNKQEIPNDQWFLTLDADGCDLQNDFYLNLAGKITKQYRQY